MTSARPSKFYWGRHSEVVLSKSAVQISPKLAIQAESTSVDRYLREVAAVPLLTPEDEVRLAKAIEAAEASMLETLLRCPSAARVLAEAARELEKGQLRLRDVVRDVDDASDAADPKALGRVVRRLRGKPEPRGKPLPPLRFTRKVIDRVARELGAERPVKAGTKRTLRELAKARGEAEAAKGRFVEANLRLVISIARRYRNQGLDLGDLLQEGNAGLMRAVDKFDHRRGFRFSTYATWWIRQAVSRAIADKGQTIRMPVHFLGTRQKALRTAQRLEQRMGREPTPGEIAAHCGLPVERVDQILLLSRRTTSLDTPVGAEGDGRLGDLFADETSLSPEESVGRTRAAVETRHLLGKLSPRERLVIEKRFGLDQHQSPLTLEEVGRELDLTRERIRQIESQALKKIRGTREAQRLRGHLMR